jgi:hypothetical protein
MMGRGVCFCVLFGDLLTEPSVKQNTEHLVKNVVVWVGGDWCGCYQVRMVSCSHSQPEFLFPSNHDLATA